MTKWLLAVAILTSIGAAQCQPRTRTSFEVASVKLNKASNRNANIGFLPGGERFIATAVPLSILIVTAYSLTTRQISWNTSAASLLSERYDISAKVGHSATRSEMLLLLQSLLSERFKLVLSSQTKEVQAYALAVEKTGLKIRASEVLHAEATPLNPYRARGMERASGYLVFKDETMEDLAFTLSTLVAIGDRVVVDRTGLKGHYDFDLKFGSELASPPSTDARPIPPLLSAEGPSIFSALREQLGLRLDLQRVRLETVRVEHAERPAEN